MRRAFLSIVTVFVFGTFFPAWATDVPIVNSSFEQIVLPCPASDSCYSSSVPGWSGGPAETSKPPADRFSAVPDGVNVVRLGQNNNIASTIAQTLSTTLQHNTTYTLSFYVGHATGTTFPGYKVELLAGTAVIASDSSLSPATGAFVRGQIVFQSANANQGLIGQPLAIRVTCITSYYVYFDKIALDATPTLFFGSDSQFASGGGWKTTLSFINLTATQSSIRIAFYGDNGQPLTIPVAITPPVSVSSPTATIDTTMAPGASLIIESEASSSTPLVGWAQVTSSEPISGYAIFRSRGSDGRDSEGTTPVDTNQTATLVLPFDNTSGFSTGVALANTTPAQVVITARIVDETGTQIGLNAVALPPMGHQSFFLANQFPVTGGRRGAVQFQNPSGGVISAIGLRFSPAGTFTSVPVVAQ